MPLSRAGTLFDGLAPRYDRGNRVISLGMDTRWKRRAVRLLAPGAGVFLDCGAGTGDLSRLLAAAGGPGCRAVALDASRPMLAAGVWGEGCAPVVGDAQRMPLPDRSVDGAITGFMLRNVPSLEAFFADAARVMKPGARLVVLEVAYPQGRVRQGAFRLYFHGIVPVLGGLATGRPGAYAYLSRSLRDFPSPQELGAMASAHGLTVEGLEHNQWSGAFLLVLRRSGGQPRAALRLPSLPADREGTTPERRRRPSVSFRHP